MKIILNGAGGRMGKAVKDLLLEGDGGDVIVAEIDSYSEGVAIKNIADYKKDADVIIDFSNHSATKELVAYALAKELPLVLCTTGQTEEELAIIEEAAKRIPVFFSANMSLGIAVLYDLAKKAAAMFPDADIEIVEAHHNKKLDAPSGTAKLLARGICEVRPEAEIVYGRSGMGERKKNEIGISALRMGNEPGMHEIFISTGTQTISLRHNAHTRAVFAEGAISAAKFLMGKGAGLYNMQSITEG